MITQTPPPIQTIPPDVAGELAIISAATSLCYAFRGVLQPEDLQGAMDRGLASVGLLPVPPETVVLVWGLAAELVKDPRACRELLK